MQFVRTREYWTIILQGSITTNQLREVDFIKKKLWEINDILVKDNFKSHYFIAV